MTVEIQDYVYEQVALHPFLPLYQVVIVMKGKSGMERPHMRLSGNNTNPFELQKPNAPPKSVHVRQLRQTVEFFSCQLLWFVEALLSIHHPGRQAKKRIKETEEEEKICREEENSQ